MSDIIDDIDALIDQQLEAGEPETGWDFGDPHYPKCWHCGRDFHGLRITERIEQMRRLGSYDPEYRITTDDTPVLCEGSEFIGPRRPTKHEQLQQSWGTRETSWSITIGPPRELPSVTEAIFAAIQYMGDSLSELVSMPLLDIRSWMSAITTWPNPVLPVPAEAPRVWRCQTDTPDIEFGPQNWHHELTRPQP